MSSHPGSTLKEAVELAEFCRDMGFNPEQVQDFYPTPSTISTCIYYTGVDPRTMEEVYCPRTPHEKAMQRALIQYRNPKNRALVTEALKAAGREDLIGNGPQCLVRPGKGGGKSGKGGNSGGTKGSSKGGREAWGKAGKAKGQPRGKQGGFQQKGMGPNKASGHKGGMGRQGSKRG